MEIIIYMEIKAKVISEEEPISIMEDFYKYPSCDFPRTSKENSEVIDIERYNSSFKKKKKNVHFNQTITIINIQSHKKRLKKDYEKYNPSIIEEDFNEEKNKKCTNCLVF